MNPMDVVEQPELRKSLPSLQPGDTVRVHVRVKETAVKEEIKGKPKETERERVQVFEGLVIGLRGSGARATRPGSPSLPCGTGTPVRPAGPARWPATTPMA